MLGCHYPNHIKEGRKMAKRELVSREEALSHPFANGKYDRKNANIDFILGHESYKEWLETLPVFTEQDIIKPYLEKIRAEIEQNAYPIVHGVNNHEKGMTLYGVLQIIDKYMTESEVKE